MAYRRLNGKTAAVWRIAHVCLSVVLIAGLLTCCSARGEEPASEYPVYASLEDVPDITGEEIRSLEAMRAQRSSFIYGTIPSTETFVDSHGETRGFTVLLCRWLTELFGIPFEIRFYDWGEMLSGLETFEIDFTGELTATDERRQIYFMTDAIASRSAKYMRIAGSASVTASAQAHSPYIPRYALLRDTTTYEDVKEQLGDSADIGWKKWQGNRRAGEKVG